VRVPPSLLVTLATLLAASSCESRRPRAAELPLPPAPTPIDVVVPENSASTELEPGTLRAYGLLMPVGTVERLVTTNSKIFYVQAPMPRVMRYLQRRLEITTADIHPLGAMVRNARIRTAPGSTPLFVDVGVRDEGDRTVVTVWNRTALPAPNRSMSEGLRNAGFDPQTGRPLSSNNY
jgi:hypothetical protein